jgi:hypothetical protein
LVLACHNDMEFRSPDPLMRDRYYLVSLVYDEKDPTVFLLDVDCELRKGAWYDRIHSPSTAELGLHAAAVV